MNDDQSAKPSTSDMSSTQSRSNEPNSSEASSTQSSIRTSLSQPPSSNGSPIKLSNVSSTQSFPSVCTSSALPSLMPTPSTSAQINNSNNYLLPTGMVIKQEPQQNCNFSQPPQLNHALTTTHLQPIIKQEPMEIATNEKMPNGLPIAHQIPPQLTPLNIKAEPVKSMTVPQLKICDQNNVNVSNLSSSNRIALPVPGTMLKATAKKTFVKCVGKDGKVSLMELVRDEKNLKLFKMVLPPGVQANKIVLQGMNQSGAPLNFIKPMTPTLSVVGQSGKIAIRVLASHLWIQLAFNKKFHIFVSVNDSMSSINSPSTSMNPIFPSTVKLPVANVHNPVANIPPQLMNRRISLGNLSSPTKNQPMPKLVAINSPHPSTSILNRTIPPPKIVVPAIQPKITPVLTTPKSASVQKTNVSSITGVMQANNKIIVLDSSRFPKNQQQSLLKPQVSLLKPRTAAVTTGGATAKVNQLKKITVSNISGLENRNINVFVPADVKFDANIKSKSQTDKQIHHKYDVELEQRFLARKSFSNVTEAIEWLLKKIPLISTMATQPEFRESFPFVVPNLADFHSLLIPKQRSFEVK